MSGAHLPLVAVYADESCLGNGREGDNPGGAGALIEFRTGSGTVVRRDLWVSERATTNNRMALRSVIEVFRALSVKQHQLRVLFTTDSNYIVKGMSEWYHGWVQKAWRTRNGPVLNQELWLEAAAAIGGHHVQWRWVRGHDSHPQNEYANDLAIRAARELSNSDGHVESGFDAWLAAKRAKGRMPKPADPFPDSADFRAARPLPGAAGMRHSQE